MRAAQRFKVGLVALCLALASFATSWWIVGEMVMTPPTSPLGGGRTGSRTTLVKAQAGTPLAPSNAALVGKSSKVQRERHPVNTQAAARRGEGDELSDMSEAHAEQSDFSSEEPLAQTARPRSSSIRSKRPAATASTAAVHDHINHAGIVYVNKVSADTAQHVSRFMSWWRTNAVAQARQILANWGGKHSFDACASTIAKRRQYTHRSPRPGELGNKALFEAVSSESDALVVMPQSAVRPYQVNPEPIVLDTSFDLSKPFGSWKARFQNVSVVETEIARLGKAYKNAAALGPQVVIDEPPAFVAFFAAAAAHKGTVAVCGTGFAYTGGACLWEMPAWKSGDMWDKAKKDAAAAALVDVAAPVCDEWCRGYYHFSHEHLPRIAMLRPLFRGAANEGEGPFPAGRVKLVFSHELVTFVKQFVFDILKFRPEDVVVGTVPARIVAYPTPMRCGNTFSEPLHILREEVFDALSLPKQRAPRVKRFKFLFAERSKLSRMPSNYEDIKAKLMKEFHSHFSFNSTQGREHASDQVTMFHDADIVLGPHGANLANTMFMLPHGHVIEMASMAKGNLCYYSTASRVPLHFHLILHGKGKDDSYTLEYELVRTHVELALRDLQSQSIEEGEAAESRIASQEK